MRHIIIFFLGASIGSFTGLGLHRFEKGSLFYPPSHCDHCLIHLHWDQLIPVVSFLTNKGHCRNCHHPIPLEYYFLECTFGVHALVWSVSQQSISFFLLSTLSLILSLFDLYYYSYPFLVWCLLTFLLIFFQPISPFFFILLGLALLATICNLNIGNGDFLYLASLSLYFNVTQLTHILFIASLTALILALSQKRGLATAIPLLPYLSFGFYLISCFESI